MTPESHVLPAPASLPEARAKLQVGTSANGIHIVGARETFRGREFLLAGWGVQAWVPESRFWLTQGRADA